jgi:hypothetical protein
MMSPVTTSPTMPHRNRSNPVKLWAPTPMGREHRAPDQPGHREQRDEREKGGGNEALVEGAHDGVRRPELDEEGAGDGGQHAGSADGQRIEHGGQLEVGGGEHDGAEHHGGDHRHDIGLEQVGRHAGAVADIVADVVGDGGRIARIVLGDPGLDLAHHVAADVGALGEDAAAETGEDGDERGAEAERHQGVDDGAAGRLIAHDRGEDAEIDRYPEQRQAGDQKPGDGARHEGNRQPLAQRLGGGLGGADIGAHRDVHADEAGRTRQDRADEKPDRRQNAEQEPADEEDDDADAGDRGVLALEVGLGALADGRGDFLHALGAGIGRHQLACRPRAIGHREQPSQNDR